MRLKCSVLNKIDAVDGLVLYDFELARVGRIFQLEHFPLVQMPFCMLACCCFHIFLLVSNLQ